MKPAKCYCLAIVFCSLLQGVLAQVPGIPVTEAIAEVEKSRHVHIFYKPEWIKDIRVDAKFTDLGVDEFLASAFKGTNITWLFFFDKQYVVLLNEPAPSSKLFSGEERKPAVTAEPLNNELFTLSGYITDGVTEEKLAGVTLIPNNEDKGTVSNPDGSYTLQLPLGTNRLRLNSVGKSTTYQNVLIEGNKQLDFEMYDQTIQLEDVVVLSQGADRNISSTDMGQFKLDRAAMKAIPPFMGEVDVIKSILSMPGVSTVGEGASGFNVRGGSVDQNLILMDDTPIFNSSHLFGFFSTFNPDFVKDVTLYKGSMPASYGGRISSVLDIRLRDGNNSKISGAGGLGIVSSRLQLEGPIGSSKTSFIIGGRYAYPDWILKKVPDLNVQRSSANFYDTNFRIRHEFNSRNSIYFSAYISNDQFKFAADTTYSWTTTNLSLRWNSTINDRLTMSVVGFHGQLDNRVGGHVPTREFTADFGIGTSGLKVDFSQSVGTTNRIDFGVNWGRYTFNNGKLSPGPNSSINPLTVQDEHAVEWGAFAASEFKINEWISTNIGLRYSQYANLGPSDVFLYDEELPKSPSTITGVMDYDKGEPIKTYNGWEPRVSAKFSISKNSSFKIGYNRNYQYIHLISNTTAVSPLDLWKSSNYYIKPQIGDQFALGYFRNFRQNIFEASIEGYYKTVENLVEYKDNADLFLNQYLESELITARGEAYGVELLFKKKEGKLTGWIAYTFSRSFRQTDNTVREETVNFGRQYPSNYDKPHDLVVVGNYAFTRRVSFSANFNYSTGRPISYPQSVYLLDGYAVAQFGQRNQVRIPDYHRLDVSLTIDESFKKKKKWKGSWTFSIYNVYGRENPYSVFFKPQFRGYQTQSYRLAVVGTAFPAITYNFKF